MGGRDAGSEALVRTGVYSAHRAQPRPRSRTTLMCGIAGQIVVTPGARIDLEVVPRTAALLAHRGPDGWAYVVDARQEVLLLNTRLAIVDVAGGRQPISNEDGQIWITLNGECYGFEQQRRWLEARGHRFRTRTDTEFLVHLYEELGERFVEQAEMVCS